MPPTKKYSQTLSIIGEKLSVPRNSVCGGGTVGSLSSMRSGEASRKNTARLIENPNLFARTLSEKLTGPWIEHAFVKRECIKFVAQRDVPDRCGCGQLMTAHSQLALSRFSVFSQTIRVEEGTPWSIATHTQTAPTDAFGTIVFQGGAHAHKAQYIRLGYDSEPEDVMYLMEKVWGLVPPKLVITVHGGMSNFEVQEKLGRLFRDGLLKAAQTTGAWIITGGFDSGVVKHVAQALDDAGISARMRSKIVTIGIAPWGVIKRKERLVAKDAQIQYDPHAFGSPTGLGVLNDHHSYFLLADNGTTSRYGADLHLRQNLEEHLAKGDANGSRKIPVVCAVLEGGTSTLKAVHQYLTREPKIPVIVCDGSGRASDLIAFASRYLDADDTFPAEVREELLSLISTVFPDAPRTPEQILEVILECARKRDLLTIFRMGESRTEDVDHAILTAVLKRQNLTLPEQLHLTLSWNRVDVARSCLFAGGRHWPIHALHSAMNDALRLNRVEFVECLLENGVNMKTFLTISTLEQLYNVDDDAQHSVRFLVEHASPNTYLTLPDIGLIIEKLMGNAYKHYYTSRTFKNNYEKFRKKAQLSRLSSFHIRLVAKTSPRRRKSQLDYCSSFGCDDDTPPDFSYPFNDLILWAVLTRRPEMAKCMWLHGEDAMAKSLVAAKLYKAIARIAEEDYLEVEMAQKLREYCDSSCRESLQLLDFCYREDNIQTLKLLTAQLPHWGHQNCLSLAVMANHKPFLAHPCCQRLLAELWHGSLRVRSGSNLRVLAALICPPAALALSYKAPYVSAGPSNPEQHNEESTTYDTISSLRTDRYERNSVGSMMSLPLQKLFKAAPTNRPKMKIGSSDELDDLVENGINGVGHQKKVTIISSKRGSAIRASCDMLVEKTLSLSPVAKMRAFYAAPITKFWSWCIAFMIFLMFSSYVLLIETPVNPTNIEYATLAYIVVYAVEHLRKLLEQETPKLREKCRVFYTKYYNLLTATALLLFLIGFVFRTQPQLRHSYGRVILSCSNVLWYMKVLEYLSVHPLLGPYIQMAAKMVVSMCYIIVLLLVTLMAFGVSRQAITYPHEKWNWLLVRNIFYKPYFMLYGEVYAGEIDTCGDEGTNCVPGGWIPPVLMTIFLLVANILLINMLIAIFNNIFNDTNIRSQEVWLFQRYWQVMEYNDTPLLPPPFTLLSYIGRLLCFCKKKPLKAEKERDDVINNCSMRLCLNAEELRELHDFEEDCMDELTRKRLRNEKGDTDAIWLNAMELTELTSQRVNELLQENYSLKSRLCDMETRMDIIAKSQRDLMDAMLRKRKQSRAESSRTSTQSLPEADDARRKTAVIGPMVSPITEQVLLCPYPDRTKAASPLLSHLRMDQTLRKYDETRYQRSPSCRRPRLNSSSLSVSQDMRDMDRNHRTSEVVTSDEDVPGVIVHEPWEDSS
ncbi:unnamed protein product [Cylicocyclus nassatus]|uniref:Uncharacterized protein n=1 Tax=Cylicocyclus nassatus TaxID=53992 RepID=A0AA36GQA4_CYLNA|nr:unnamed protein product [Cylicocyclus nassatus]